MGLYELLFGYNKQTKNFKLTNESIKRMARKAGILYLTKDSQQLIRNIFNSKRNEIINKLKLICSHRGGKVIKSSDLQLLNLLNKYVNYDYNENINKIQYGGNESWCDSNPSQCQDSISLCGGGKIQDGGNESWCDSNPSQCQDSISLCGGGSEDSESINSSDSFNDYTSKYINTNDLQFVFPHKTFKRNIKKNKNTDLKMSKNLVYNLHRYLEDQVHSRLLLAKNNLEKNKEGITKLAKYL